ncbi:hypothetical protein [Kitasatospora fiedleri]|uniref:hypothetical protein n=1 Tax=Kitasatospora fiedleri TaxID=2991545 RepID=UPI00249B51D4|nr:hypothetical protein [Kitasatospora fiedleri]
MEYEENQDQSLRGRLRRWLGRAVALTGRWLRRNAAVIGALGTVAGAIAGIVGIGR